MTAARQPVRVVEDVRRAMPRPASCCVGGNENSGRAGGAGPAWLSPRPIWEGFSDDTSVTTDKQNTFAYGACGSYFYVSTSQLSQSTAQNTMTTSQMLQNTRISILAKAQQASAN